ncbi:MAG: branched-chain amino acid transporter permease [Rhodoferax sp.]|nr:branched-chain amino acid transporter permease [Rhodoferax sp.]
MENHYAPALAHDPGTLGMMPEPSSQAPRPAVASTAVGTTAKAKWTAAATFAVLLLAGAALPRWLASPLLLSLLTQAVISAILATSVGFLVRQNGLVSFGQAAFYGLAGYVVALSLARGIASAEWSILAAIVIPTVLACVLGALFLRLVGVAFSMLTLAVAQGFHEVFLRWRELANGEDGMKVNLPDALFGIRTEIFQRPESMFVICWAALMVVLLGLWLLTRSNFGTLTLAIRENEERVRFIGYATNLPRVMVYAVSAAIAALSGVLFAVYNGFMTPETLHWSLSGEILIMAIIGGTRQVWGPALGAVVFFFLKGSIGDVTEHWPAIIGTLLIVVVVLLPGGISGLPGLIKARLEGARK